jgi:hypothetical protein
VILSFATMEEREWKPRSSPEVKDNYLYPSQISSCWGRLTPESPACKDRRLRLPGDKRRSLWPRSLETRTGNRGLHHSSEKQVWEAKFFGRSLQFRTNVSSLKGRSLWSRGLESPPRKSPTTRFLQSSLQQIAKGCKCILSQNDFTPAFH